MPEIAIIEAKAAALQWAAAARNRPPEQPAADDLDRERVRALGSPGADTALRCPTAHGVPHQEAAHRVAAVERGEEPTDLLPVPDVPALELRKRHVTGVDQVKDLLHPHDASSSRTFITSSP